MQPGGRRRWAWIFWPGLFLYFFWSHRSRVLIIDGSKVLLMQDNNRYLPVDSRWSLPGGGIKRGEQPAVGAVRELHEELGITIPPEALTLMHVGRTGEYHLVYTGHFFILRPTTAFQLRIDPKEVTLAAWVEISSLTPQNSKRELTEALQLLATQ